MARRALAALLPAAVDEGLRQWSLATPGACRPWEGHVTVIAGLASKSPAVPAAQLEHRVGQVCAGQRPFWLRLNQVVRDAYWDKPGLEIVMLVGGAADGGMVALAGLRRALVAALAPVTRDLWPAFKRRPYRPHLTLTSGLPPAEAADLAVAASQLDIGFEVQQVVLYEVATSASSGTQCYRLRRTMALGGGVG